VRKRLQMPRALARKLPRSAICTFRFATLLTFETLALYSRISPAFNGKLTSAGDTLFLALVGFKGFPARTPARLAAGGGCRKPGGSATPPLENAVLLTVNPIESSRGTT